MQVFQTEIGNASLIDCCCRLSSTLWTAFILPQLPLMPVASTHAQFQQIISIKHVRRQHCARLPHLYAQLGD